MSSRDRDAERRVEATFAMQQELLRKQEQFLTQRNAESQQVLDLLQQAEAGNREAQELALGDLNRAISGEASPALQSFLDEEQLRMEEVIRRNLGVGGETSSPGIDLQKEMTLANAQAIENARQGDIAAAVGATTGVGNLEDARIGRFLQAIDNPLQGSQVLGQSVANLGKLSQFNVPQDTFARDLGMAGISALGSTPNFGGNIGGNISGISAFLTGLPGVPGAFGTSFKQQAINKAKLNAGIFPSSIKYKENVSDMGSITSKRIYDLNPVSFKYKEDKAKSVQYGLIAEEVAKVIPEMVVFDEQGKPDMIDYSKLIVLLLSELQEIKRDHQN